MRKVACRFSIIQYKTAAYRSQSNGLIEITSFIIGVSKTLIKLTNGIAIWE
jgi:hypothetical protein